MSTDANIGPSQMGYARRAYRRLVVARLAQRMARSGVLAHLANSLVLPPGKMPKSCPRPDPSVGLSGSFEGSQLAGHIAGGAGGGGPGALRQGWLH